MLRDRARQDRRGLRPDREVREEAPLSDEASWEADFERKIRGGDVLGASDTLRKTGKEGWVRKAQHDRAAEIIDAVAPAPIVRRDWALRLLSHPRRVDRELACAILLPLAKSHARDLERAIDRLKDDTDPAVRRAVTRLERALAPASEVGGA